MIAAAIFEWLHGAEFYEQFHREAVKLLPSGTGRTWLDVGCGPGVLSRAAALHGYQVRAVDRQAAMIKAANRQTPNLRGLIDFAVSDLDAEAERPVVYDVVSASSLLTVLPDPMVGFGAVGDVGKARGRYCDHRGEPQDEPDQRDASAGEAPSGREVEYAPRLGDSPNGAGATLTCAARYRPD